MMKTAATILFVMMGSLGVGLGSPDTGRDRASAPNYQELQKQIAQVLTETGTPGAAVAVVLSDGSDWATGVGLADVKTQRAVTNETLFRIGSVSKAFAALSLLKLANEGRVSLDDPIRKIAPEVWFVNRWEATDPVRIVHLLEHTTGWDDWHWNEAATDSSKMSLLEAINHSHASRISRWPPGTRVAYCNSGAGVAAYIVEKISGQRYEEFVKKNFFDLIGMKNATYFKPKEDSRAVAYHPDGKTPYPYRDAVYRAPGAINASATDMVSYLRFYLNRGTLNGTVVTPASSVERMESPATTWAAREGLKAGYGLGNTWNIQEGYAYHGHGGGLEGAVTMMAYMPEYGVGYFFSINKESSQAYQRIDKLLRTFVTAGTNKPALPPVSAMPSNAAEYDGWYQDDSPRSAWSVFFSRFLWMVHLRAEKDRFRVASLGGTDTYLPVSGAQFRRVPASGAPEPVATMMLLAPRADGRYIQILTGLRTMKRVPTPYALAQIGLVVFVLLSFVSIIVYAPFWILGGLIKKRRRPAERVIRLLPLVAVTSLVLCVYLVMLSVEHFMERMTDLTAWSGTLFLLTLVFAAASVLSAVALWRAPEGTIRRSVQGYSTVVTVALLIATVYLAYWGLIGWRIWV
jgi:CubicO group peptidase (beta-lactamase class C family)